MTKTITQADIDAMIAVTGLSDEASALMQKAIAKAEWELMRANLPDLYRSDRLTCLIEYYADEEGMLVERFIVFEQDANSECKSVRDIAERRSGANDDLFSGIMKGAIDGLKPKLIEPAPFEE